jgi:hypothetical protein
LALVEVVLRIRRVAVAHLVVVLYLAPLHLPEAEAAGAISAVKIMERMAVLVVVEVAQGREQVVQAIHLQYPHHKEIMEQTAERMVAAAVARQRLAVVKMVGTELHLPFLGHL